MQKYPTFPLLCRQNIKMTKTFTDTRPFALESGAHLPELHIHYCTYGNLNEDASNVVWICHALTANADVAEWWPGMMGQGAALDPERYFIVCANILGSCYGSSGPLSTDPTTGAVFGNSFPSITIRDMVNAHIRLREHLCIQKIRLLVGGSMGGYQTLEWVIMEPTVIDQLFLLATSATESAWGIAVHTAQRMAIEAEEGWDTDMLNGGKKGLKAARAIGMLSYRNYGNMVKTQTDPDSQKLDGYRASSYILHQGNKLAERFNAYSYWLLTKAMDTHQLARGRTADVISLLQQIHQPTLIIGISSDILCPPVEQEQIAAAIPNAQLVIIDSIYGHDGFLVEAEKIAAALKGWMKDE